MENNEFTALFKVDTLSMAISVQKRQVAVSVSANPRLVEGFKASHALE